MVRARWLRWTVVWASGVAASLSLGGCYPNADELRGPNKGTGSGGAVGPGSGGASGTASGGAVGTASGGAVGSGSGGSPTGSGGRSGTGGAVTATGGYSGDGTALVATATGWINGPSNAFGIQGGWYAYADGQGADRQGTGPCQAGGYTDAQCSKFTAPPPGPQFPPTAGAMCTAGSVGRVLNNAMGQPDYDHIWGAGIGFDFANPGGSALPGPYDAAFNKVAGIAFTLDVIPPTGIRIDFPTPETENNPASWGGLTLALSPVRVGRNEIRWAEVGGPNYLVSPPAFDTTRIRSMHFHIPADPGKAGSFAFCISNLTVLTR